MLMKKSLILFIILFHFGVSLAQTKTENKAGNQGFATGGFKPNRQVTPARRPTNSNPAPMSYQNNCFTGLEFTVRNYGYNKDGNFYAWGVKVKNNYSKPIQIQYTLVIGDEPAKGGGTLTYFIKPGESYTNEYGRVSAIIANNNSDEYRIEVSKPCFEGQDCSLHGYLGCNMAEVIANQAASNSGGHSVSSSADSRQTGSINYNHADNNALTENTGAKVTEEDVKRILNQSLEQKIKVLKPYFVQKGFTVVSEGSGTLKYPTGDSKKAYIIDFGLFKLHIDNANGGIGIMQVGNNRDDNSRVFYSVGRLQTRGDGRLAEHGQPQWTDWYIINE